MSDNRIAHVKTTTGPSVGVVVVYFGNCWPSYHCKWEESASHTPFHFHVFSDISTASRFCNITYHNETIDSYKKRITETFGIQPHISSGYKLCDHKPFIGALFEKELRPYSHYGWCDIDMVFGSFDDFEMPSADIISFRKHWLSGGFALFKNTAEIRHSFEISKDWRSALETESFLSFTEVGKNKHLKQGEGKDIFQNYLNGIPHPKEAWSIDAYGLCLHHSQHQFQYFSEDMISEQLLPLEVLKYDQGELKSSLGRKHRIFHFVLYKSTPFWRISSVNRSFFYISETGISSRKLPQWIFLLINPLSNAIRKATVFLRS